MADSLMQGLFAARIGGRDYGKSTAIYKFQKIKRAKAAAKAAFPDRELLDLGVGEPDEPAFPEAVDVLRQEAGKAENRFYTDNGILPFQQAAARWMNRVCGVALDPATEVVHSIGSKAALALLPACFVDPGDLVLMTTPGYPVFGTHAKYFGAEVKNLSLTKDNGFLPDLGSVSADECRRAKALVLNYPNNPTGVSATPAFFVDAVEFCRRHGILLIHDAAYAALVFAGRPLSILSVPGAKDVAIELHSLSKAFNMTGWRLGWVCGNPHAVRAYADVKDNSDSGQFAGIQLAGAYCLDHPEITTWIANKYSRRMDLAVEVLRRAGFDAAKPQGSFFLYAGAPKSGVDAKGDRQPLPTAEDAARFLITEHGISTVPWDDAGAFLRFSVTFQAKDPDDERRVAAELLRRLRAAQLEF